MTRHTFVLMPKQPQAPIPFGRELELLLEKKGISQAELAEKLGHPNQGLVSNVINQRRPPPLDDLMRWLDAIGVDDREKMRLYRLAMRAYAPKYVQGILETLDKCTTRVQLLLELLQAATGIDFRRSHDPNEQKKIDAFLRQQQAPGDSSTEQLNRLKTQLSELFGGTER